MQGGERSVSWRVLGQGLWCCAGLVHSPGRVFHVDYGRLAQVAERKLVHVASFWPVCVVW